MLSSLTKIGVGVILTLSFNQTTAQEIISSSGDSYSNNQVQLDFTLGQIINSTSTSSNVIVTQGFHQTFDETIPLKVSDSQVEFNVFPNPTDEIINIQTNYSKGVMFTLYDLEGRKVANGEFTEKTTLNVKTQAKGIYQLLLTNSDGQIINTFKIQLK